MPRALKPSGSYKYVGEKLTVELRLLREKQTVGTLTLRGEKNDLPGLAARIVTELVTAIDKLPKPAASPPQ